MPSFCMDKPSTGRLETSPGRGHTGTNHAHSSFPEVHPIAARTKQRAGHIQFHPAGPASFQSKEIPQDLTSKSSGISLKDKGSSEEAAAPHRPSEELLLRLFQERRTPKTEQWFPRHLFKCHLLVPQHRQGLGDFPSGGALVTDC